MSKFKVGDKVVCINDDGVECFDYLGEYLVVSVWDDQIATDAKGDYGYGWWENRFELLEEWAKHQKPASNELELQITKDQVASLQESNEAFRESLLMILAAIDEPTLIANKQWKRLMAVENARELLK